MIKVLVVDDHDLVRTGISRMLSDVAGLRGWPTSTGEDALRYRKENRVDVVLMDAKMPGIGGLEATRKLLRQYPDVRVDCRHCLTKKTLSLPVFAGWRGEGYVTKGAGIEEMVKAIRLVHAGQRYVRPKVAQQLALKPFSTAEASP